MEEIWNNISLPSLCAHPNTTSTATTTADFASLQDFLAKPFNRKNPPSRSFAAPPSITKNNATSSSSCPSLATELSLSSGLDFNFPETTDSDRLKNISMFSGGNTMPFQYDPLTSPSGFPSVQPFSKKREAEKDENQDHRYKRMMKNREAATRSRARRQAYANELELEVAFLREENAKLKRQQEKMRMAAPPALVPQKKTLYRTLTAPF